MLTSDNKNVQAFAEAREKFDHNAEQVAAKFDISKQHVYRLLRRPNQNPELFKKICAYIESAGVEVPDKYEGEL